MNVVCRSCLTRWEADTQPRVCITEGCEAGWLDLPMFVDLADADRAAARFAQEREPQELLLRDAVRRFVEENRRDPDFTNLAYSSDLVVLVDGDVA